MAPRKSTTSRAKKAASAAPKTARKKTVRRKTTRVAARAHTAAVSHHAPHGRADRYHTYTDHRSDSYKHYASIMKTIILFLGFVLLLALLANLFSPSIGGRADTATARRAAAQNFLDTRASGYRGYAAGNKPYRYAVPEGTDSSASSGASEPAAPAPEAPAQPEQ